MQLRPHDLGPTWHIAVVRQRAIGAARVVIQPRVGPLGRIWSRGLGLTEKVISHTLPMAADKTGPLVGGVTTGVGLVGTAAIIGSLYAPSTALTVEGSFLALALTAAATYASVIALPRRLFQRLHWQPLRVEELMDLKGVETRTKPANLPELPALKFVKKFMHNLRGTAPRRSGDGLEQAFLELAISAIRTDNLSETTQSDLRRTLAELGEAVSALPPAEKENVEPSEMVAEAETQTARSRRETDPLLAASYLRHAEALVARARNAELRERQYRQTRALRDEMVAQIAAVQAALPVLSQTAVSHDLATGTATLDAITAQVQSLTREAAAVTRAQEELANATGTASNPAARYSALYSPQPQDDTARLQQGRQ